MKRTARAAVGLAAALLAAPLAAQDYPAKPVRVIVPNAPGGLADIAARLVAGKLSENLGRQFLVDNRVGAGGIIGTAAAARAVPDGYTLLVVFDSHATNPHLFNKLEYDTLADFTPVSLLVKGPMLLVVQPKVPAGSVQEFVQLAKAKPGAVNFLTVGPGSPARLLTELFKSTAGIDVTMVSYKGAGPAMTDLIAGVVDAMFATIPTVSAQVRAKKLRALAVTSDSRFQFLPEVPAMAELFPGFRAEVWVGMFAPAKVSQAIVSRLNAEAVKAVAAEDVKARFLEIGMTSVGSSPVALDRWLRFEMERWGKVIRDNRITLE